jgi:hypothetical protein
MSITQNDILAAIEELGKEPPKRPSGKEWKTVGEMAKAQGVSRGAFRHRMKLALDRGLKVERFVGSDYDTNGTLVKQTWFRVKR